MQRKLPLKAYKYRIYPSDAQVVFFAKTFGCCRFVWNEMLGKKLHAYKWYVRTLIQTDRFFPSSKLCHRCDYKNEDLTLHDRTWCCPSCGETHDRDVNASINLYLVGLGRPEVTPVERALVDDRSPYGLPKKPSRDEAGSSTFTVEQSACLNGFSSNFLSDF
jgi:transposase